MWIDKESEYQIHIFFSAMSADIVKKRKNPGIQETTLHKSKHIAL